MDPKRLDKVLKTQKYIMDMRPIFNMDALFSDQGTLHLALPPLPTLLIGLDCPKKRPEALRSRLRP